MPDADNLREAKRLMTICNSCRYCEGLCAVFPAMELRRTFARGDLNHLANLCHNCGACYDDCQFTPPHEFAVNVPQTLAKVRRDSWSSYVWPGSLSHVFQRNGVVVALALAVCVAAFIFGFVAWHDPAVLFAVHTGPGAFYKLMPHEVMVALFGGAFLFAIVAMSLGLRNFWRDADAAVPVKTDLPALWQAVKDAATLRNLDGGGVGCFNEDEEPTDNRRLYHHLTFYGFLLCFASTSTATLYHWAGIEAPYPWYYPPVVLGTLGGIGIVIGPIGLISARYRRRVELKDEAQGDMDNAFSLMLILTGVTGLALLFLRATPAMGILLAVHLGVVFALFITLPYGRFVHGIYRYAALVRHAREMRMNT